MEAFIPPELTPDTAPFWQGCARGQLLITRCKACGFYLHPPRPACRRCRSMDVEPVPVSGRGTIHTFTVAHHAFVPGLPVPYVIAIVELDEQAGLRMTTNVVDCDPSEVHIGMRVEVVFAPIAGREDIAVPHVRPEAREGR